MANGSLANSIKIISDKSDINKFPIRPFWQCLKNQTSVQHIEKGDLDKSISNNKKMVFKEFLKKMEECLDLREKNRIGLQKKNNYLKDLLNIIPETDITFTWDFLIRNRGTINLWVNSMREQESSKNYESSEEDFYY